MCDRQKQRRRTEIGNKLQEYLGVLDQEAGLLPVTLETQTTKCHDSVSIPLSNSSVDGASSSSPSAHSDEIPLESVQYLIMKYNIPLQFYHELSMLFSDLPRSHKVAIASFLTSSACTCPTSQIAIAIYLVILLDSFTIAITVAT